MSEHNEFIKKRLKELKDGQAWIERKNKTRNEVKGNHVISYTVELDLCPDSYDFLMSDPNGCRIDGESDKDFLARQLAIFGINQQGLLCWDMPTNWDCAIEDHSIYLVKDGEIADYVEYSTTIGE